MSANKTTTPGSTTVKVSTNTGAAKDDLFAGLNEDNVIANFNVLANDPGSAKIWSLDQNALKALASSQQPQDLSVATLASGARISINADGTVHYEGGSALQSLAEGETFHDSFIYTIRMANGALSTATATAAITGVNDAAVFGGAATGSVQEDGVLTTGGVLTVSDLDHDQSAFAATGNLAGAYGDFSFDLGTGAWSYALRNAAADVQALASGQSVQDKLQVTSVDGSATELVVSIAGLDESVVVPPAQENPADKWTVSPQNVMKTGGGLQVRFENDVAEITGFDGNDTLHYTSLDKEILFSQLIDTDNDGSVDATLLNFSFGQGQDVEHLDVILVGYTAFTEAQLFLDK